MVFYAPFKAITSQQMAFRETASDLPKAESTVSPQWAHSKLTKTDVIF